MQCYPQCPSDRSPAVEGCDCPSGKPGLPGLPGPMVRHFSTLHPIGWTDKLAEVFCSLGHLIKTHNSSLFQRRASEGRKGEKDLLDLMVNL